MIYSKNKSLSKEGIKKHNEDLKKILNSKNLVLKPLCVEERKLRKIRLPIFTPVYKYNGKKCNI